VDGFNDKRSKLNSGIIKNVAWFEIRSICVQDTDFNSRFYILTTSYMQGISLLFYTNGNVVFLEVYNIYIAKLFF
jgi:hypothetical protein